MARKGVENPDRLGGDELLQRLQSEHMAGIARRSGRKQFEYKGPDWFSEIGQKGGNATASTHGHEHYLKIGREGGEKLKASKGPDFYRRIGRMGGFARQR